MATLYITRSHAAWRENYAEEQVLSRFPDLPEEDFRTAVVVWMRDHQPIRYERTVCHDCHGEGTSSAYLGAFTPEDFLEDPEFMDDYLGGHYDRNCPNCNGNKIVDIPIPEGSDKAAWDNWIQWITEESESEAIYAMERAMGA